MSKVSSGWCQLKAGGWWCPVCGPVAWGSLPGSGEPLPNSGSEAGSDSDTGNNSPPGHRAWVLKVLYPGYGLFHTGNITISYIALQNIY